MDRRLVPGIRVRHPGAPEWGTGQVQSAIGARVTVNFEHAGKQVINSEVVTLDLVPEHATDSPLPRGEVGRPHPPRGGTPCR
ncbi:MAG: DUF3553 domain-containing protein [Alphaproteobacteria bacterium]